MLRSLETNLRKKIKKNRQFSEPQQQLRTRKRERRFEIDRQGVQNDAKLMTNMLHT
jgi:hypothetical protein